jgi:hypothetical protein
LFCTSAEGFYNFYTPFLFIAHCQISAQLECMPSVLNIPCPPIEASSIDRTHQKRSPEDEGRAIPGNVVVYKQGDDGESPKFKKK